MSSNHQDTRDKKIFITAISLAVVVGSFTVGSQLLQPSVAQDLNQSREQARERIHVDGNLTGNQTDGVLGQLGEQIRNRTGQ
jgi:hypothetical protein